MEWLAKFVDSEFFDCEEYERIGSGRNGTGADNPAASLVFACSRTGTRKAEELSDVF
jgi:hypothetical protein